MKYGESSIITKIFTKEYGLQSFIVKGVRSEKSKKNLVYFQPLQLLKITASYIKKNNLQQIKDITCLEKNVSFKINIKKKFICLFMAEVLLKILKENNADKKLFDFIWETKDCLDTVTINNNFSISFLLKLSTFLGFPPSKENLNNNYFDLEKGLFVNKKSDYTTNQKNTDYLKLLLINPNCDVPKKNREELLEILLNYYKIQHHELKNLTSHLIIKSLFV